MSVFEKRIREQVFPWSPNKVWQITEYACPVCNQWFQSYSEGNSMGVRMHIGKVAKSEMVAKGLGELESTPHFDLWQAYTRPTHIYYKPREWTVV